MLTHPGRCSVQASRTGPPWTKPLETQVAPVDTSGSQGSCHLSDHPRGEAGQQHVWCAESSLPEACGMCRTGPSWWQATPKAGSSVSQAHVDPPGQARTPISARSFQ